MRTYQSVSAPVSPGTSPKSLRAFLTGILQKLGRAEGDASWVVPEALEAGGVDLLRPARYRSLGLRLACRDLGLVPALTLGERSELRLSPGTAVTHGVGLG